MVNGINGDAEEIVDLANHSLEILTRHLKELVEDSQKKPSDIIVNWRQLNMASRTPIAQRLVEDFEKVSTFYQLLQLYAESADG
jgi:orotate phosphoribosyltransferase-like protein